MAIALFVAACGGGSGGTISAPGTGSTPTLQSIALTTTVSVLTIGTPQKIVVSAAYSDGSSRDVTSLAKLTSNDPTVFAVASDGTLTGLTPGIASVGVNYNGSFLTNTVTVRFPQSAISYIHSFGNSGPLDGSQPNGGLLRASDGNFYGTTRAGGGTYCTVGCGTIFRLTSGGEESVLYRFGASSRSDGAIPSGTLIQARDGALYGLTYSGGIYGGGTAFKITLGGSYTLLHSFGGLKNDGITPLGALVQAADGNFYGATASGGDNHCIQIPQAGGNCGTIFRMTPTGDTQIIYSFGQSADDGLSPNGSLIEAADGNLYGMTQNGGANLCTSGGVDRCGTAFRISLAGRMTQLHSFGKTAVDGAAPVGGFIAGQDGNFYALTVAGGGGVCSSTFGCGTVFRMTPNGDVTVIYAFGTKGALNDGSGPGSLIFGPDGNLYGTTISGGAAQRDMSGTVYKLTPSGQKTILYSFGLSSDDPTAPLGIIPASGNSFFGITTYSGNRAGMEGFGTVFRLSP